MQLLYGRPVPSVEFASLSLLVSSPKNAGGGPSSESGGKQSQKSYGSSSSSSSSSSGMTAMTTSIGEESLIAVSPTATVAQHVAHHGVVELHDYLANLVVSRRAAAVDGNKNNDGVASKTAEPKMNGSSNDNQNDVDLSTTMSAQRGSRNGQRRPLRPRSSSSSATEKSSRIMALRNDASVLFGDEESDTSFSSSSSSVHFFRPSGLGGWGGLGIHYAIVRDADFVKKCASILLLPSSASSASSPSQRNSVASSPSAKKSSTASARFNSGTVDGNGVELTAVVLCIGVTGAPWGQFPSAVLHSLPSKIRDCLTLLRRLVSSTPVSAVSGKKEEQYRRCARSLLNAVLLDEEEIKTNEVAEAEYNPDVLGGLATGDWTGAMTSSGVKASAITKKFAFSNVKTAMGKKKADAKKKGPPVLPSTTSATSGADVARIVMEQLQILSLAEKDMSLRPYEARQSVRRKMEERALARNSVTSSAVGTSRMNRTQGNTNRSPIRPKVRIRRGFSNVTGGAGGASLSELSAFDYAGPDGRAAAGTSGTGTFPFRSSGLGGVNTQPSGAATKSADTAASSSVVVPTIMAPRNDSVTAGKSIRARHKASRSNRRPAPMSTRKESTGSVSVISFGQNYQVSQAGDSSKDVPPAAVPFNAKFDQNEDLVGAVVGSSGGKKAQGIRFPRQESHRRKKASAIERREGMMNDQSPFQPNEGGGFGSSGGGSGAREKAGNTGKGVVGTYEDDDMASIGSNSVRSYQSNHSAEGGKGASLDKQQNSTANGEGGPQREIGSGAGKGKTSFDPFALSKDSENASGNDYVESFKGSAVSKSMLSVVDEVSYISGALDSPGPPTSQKSIGSSDTLRTTNNKESDLAGIGDEDRGHKQQHLPSYGSRSDGISREMADDVAEDVRETASWTPSESRRGSDQAVDPSMLIPSSPADSSDLHTSDRATPPHLLVNLALNEDLSCSYKQSKISSCSIEGILQVQVKADSDVGVPFNLLLRDQSRHIRAIKENETYAKDISDESQPNERADYKFTLTIPKADSYFPIMRYKCSSELRPVPIRVQTRVRLHGSCCRVALQISSNPANEDDLTDLTIIMAVPAGIKGETLTTSPPGGVWNAAKRSVLWCVAELGDGEKFQLQAQFEMDDSGEESLFGPDRSEKPSFPVLVRCQCMYSQLSDIEFEVSDVPEAPAEVTMKLARRFRLSHREKS